FRSAQAVAARIGPETRSSAASSGRIQALIYTARDGPHDQKRFGPRCDRVGQRGVRRFVRQVLLASEEPHERPALLRDVVANRALQHWIPGLECVENRALRHWTCNLELNFAAAELSQSSQVRRKHDADDALAHDSVWTSTESTAGRSRTMGFQLSPASADAYTWPPVVPKYTPQESSESIAMASRSTLT